jgi:hypothetical protein
VRITHIVGITKSITFDSSGEEEHISPGDSFVDDRTTGVTNDDTTIGPFPVEVIDLTQSEEDLIGQMQIIIQFFLDLL